MNDNVLKIPGKLLVITYHITFSYTTKRNNQRERTVEIKDFNEEGAKFWFSVWWQTESEHKAFRAYCNVNILQCVEVSRELIEM